jgi:putative membrane protein
MTTPATPEHDPRVYFAAERTFLAWIRTGLGLMGVGFAVARFGLFLRQMQASQTTLQSHVAPHSSGLSVYSGVALVSLGVIVLIASVAQHLILIRELSSGTWNPGISRNAVLLASILASIGVAMAVYLLVLR